MLFIKEWFERKLEEKNIIANCRPYIESIDCVVKKNRESSFVTDHFCLYK